MIGSPGQGAYVAANAWLEGFARELRLKVCPPWPLAGARSRMSASSRVTSSLGVACPHHRRGGHFLGESLAHLGRMLVLGKQAYPTQFYTNIAPSGAAEKLRLINAPTFVGLGLAVPRKRARMAATS